MTRYLRVVVTPRCPLACTYCHQEGDPATRTTLTTDELTRLLALSVSQGIRKIKFLGGEPLVRADLPDIIRFLSALDPTLDVSVITSGALPVARLKACFDAGLTRANMSIHGWTQDAFARNRGLAPHYQNRNENLQYLLEQGRFLKLNYVWSDETNTPDLSQFLNDMAGKPVVINLLDDLTRNITPQDLQNVLIRLRGPYQTAWTEPDPNSLPTRHLSWADGLHIEIKDQQLGKVAPWKSCTTCPVRSRCKEGIHALRLTHQGELRPCMDRPDLSQPLRPYAAQQATLTHLYQQFTESV